MFDLAVSAEQEALRDTLRVFAARKLRPIARECEDAVAMPEGLRRELRSLGVAAPVLEEFGGGGSLTPLDYVIAAEELAYGDPGLAYASFSEGHAALLLGLCGNVDQQARYLPGLADGTLAGSVLLYEGWGRSPSEFETAANHSGERWKVSGRKLVVANAGRADVSIVAARDVEADQLRVLVFEGSPAGYLVERDDGVTGRIALGAARTGSVVLQDLELDDDSMLVGKGDILERAVAWVRLTVAAIALGAGRAAIEYAIKYAQERIAFGKPIASFQGISFMLVDADMALDAARLSIWDAAQALDQTGCGIGFERLITEVVNSACAAVVTATRDAVQVLGGSGFIKDHPVERWYRSAIALAAIDADPLETPVRL